MGLRNDGSHRVAVLFCLIVLQRARLSESNALGLSLDSSADDGCPAVGLIRCVCCKSLACSSLVTAVYTRYAARCSCTCSASLQRRFGSIDIAISIFLARLCHVSYAPLTSCTSYIKRTPWSRCALTYIHGFKVCLSTIELIRKSRVTDGSCLASELMRGGRRFHATLLLYGNVIGPG